MTAFKKTTVMRTLERLHGQPIEQIVADAIRAAGTAEGAAQALGVSSGTLRRKWMPAMGIEIRREVVVTAP